ncbi:uncharacterized protein LOC121367782 isoform X2 [Gigantopelta aegis]|uniref:uncharacterized protein LOC121367782 isoform X2 n=1 Tax=Gigantopelta aegis TaxID=1735272 RepID=UPI001B887D72|nr:uncharacterized protein LOC121367782 isoform X2 [Gigantopelta aegis]
MGKNKAGESKSETAKSSEPGKECWNEEISDGHVSDPKEKEQEAGEEVEQQGAQTAEQEEEHKERQAREHEGEEEVEQEKGEHEAGTAGEHEGRRAREQGEEEVEQEKGEQEKAEQEGRRVREQGEEEQEEEEQAYYDDYYEYGEEEEEEEEGEEEEEEPTMSPKDKRDAYLAVKAGDIDLLDDILDRPNADINMIYFNENLLMAAIRAKELEMAEFLIDNGINYNYKTSLITADEVRQSIIEWSTYSCRQMAYDRDMTDIVELIDYKNDDLFFFVKLRERVPRYRKAPSITSDLYACSASSIALNEDEVYYTLSGEELLVAKKKSPPDDDSVAELMPRRKSRRSTLLLRKSSMPRRKSSMAMRKSSGSFRSSIADGSDSGLHSAIRGKSKLSLPYIDKNCSSMFLFPSMDEGYGTVSMKSSPSLFIKNRQEKKRLQIPIRETKAFSDRQKSVVDGQLNTAKSRSHYEQPLSWQKVQTCGSYVTESPRWHVNRLHRAGRETTPETTISIKIEKLKPEPQNTRLTKSAYTKRKLYPTFTRAYSDLGFAEPYVEKTRSSSASARLSSQASQTYKNTTKPTKPASYSTVSKEVSKVGPAKLKTYSITQAGLAKLGVLKTQYLKQLQKKVEIAIAAPNYSSPKNDQIIKVL